jgi:negative regulator of sigma E activity
MNEIERSSQLSSLFDGQLPPEQMSLVIRRAMKDGQMRSNWGRYALIGAAIRNEPLAVRSSLNDDVAARVAARLSAEAPIALVAPPVLRTGQPREARLQFARGAWGMAVAASVAAVSLVVLRSQAPMPAASLQVAQSVTISPAIVQPTPAAQLPALEVPSGGTRLASLAAPGAAASEALPSYTTPVSSADAARFGQPLVNYVVAHSEVTTSAVRLSPLSLVMSAGQDITQGTVEMTEAEIGAHR